jgi:hypothetical protein
MLIIGLVLGAIAYIQVGYNVIGKWSWRVWHGKKRGAASLLLFPIATYENTVGEKGHTLVADDHDEKPYRTLMAFIWPLKLLWGVSVGSCIGVCGAVYHSARLGGKAAVWLAAEAPNAFVRRVTGRPIEAPRLAAKQPQRIDPAALAEADEAALSTEERFRRLDRSNGDPLK